MVAANTRVPLGRRREVGRVSEGGGGGGYRFPGGGVPSLARWGRVCLALSPLDSPFLHKSEGSGKRIYGGGFNAAGGNWFWPCLSYGVLFDTLVYNRLSVDRIVFLSSRPDAILCAFLTWCCGS